MKNLRNERGVALVTALCLTMISLAIVMALLYMITWQSRLSGAHKRYKTAIEASQGGAEIFTKQMIPMVFNNYTAALSKTFEGITVVPYDKTWTCMSNKLKNPASLWPTLGCGPNNNPANPATLYDPTIAPDVTLTLQGTQSPFTVYTKIVDTQVGNSDLSGNDFLLQGGGTDSSPPDVSPKHIPTMYRIEVQGQMATNPLERAKLSVLYAY